MYAYAYGGRVYHHIEFITNPNNSEIHQREAEAYVKAFFEDSGRDPAKGIKRAQVRQGVVHQAIGKTLDGFNNTTVPAATLHANIYRAYSNNVHGKYPETMDLYGGTPGRFHLRGMSGTPKDLENFDILESFIITATNCMVMIVQRLNLKRLIAADPVLAKWYTDFFKETT
jgi:hypothetical protein